MIPYRNPAGHPRPIRRAIRDHGPDDRQDQGSIVHRHGFLRLARPGYRNPCQRRRRSDGVHGQFQGWKRGDWEERVGCWMVPQVIDRVRHDQVENELLIMMLGIDKVIRDMDAGYRESTSTRSRRIRLSTIPIWLSL
jgi:hypothetical protein